MHPHQGAAGVQPALRGAEEARPDGRARGRSILRLCRNETAPGTDRENLRDGRPEIPEGERRGDEKRGGADPLPGRGRMDRPGGAS